MRLIEFTDEHGNVSYKTPDGTPVSAELIKEWKLFLQKVKQSNKEADEYYHWLQSLKGPDSANT